MAESNRLTQRKIDTAKPRDKAYKLYDGGGLEGYFEDRKAVPLPSENDGEHVVVLPALETAKILLLNEMVQQNVKKAEMARRLDVHMPQIDRLLNLRHNTKIDFLEKAAEKLGKNLNISFS